MSTAHFYVFGDGCPTDWLETGRDDRWHTLVYLLFQSDPHLQGRIGPGIHFHEVLENDPAFQDLVLRVQQQFPGNKLKKWKTPGTYKRRFVEAFSLLWNSDLPAINAFSFEERTLRESKEALIRAYNEQGRTDGDIGFGEDHDARSRTVMRHEYVDQRGYHRIERLENQMLVLLFMAWAIADQYRFYRAQMPSNVRHLSFTVVSDKLSGDDDVKEFSAAQSRNAIVSVWGYPHDANALSGQ